MVLTITKWKGKVAIVTGAGSGIGAAVVDQLIDHGLIVVGIDVDSARLNEKKYKYSEKKGSFTPIRADVSNETEILNAFEWIDKNLGHVHILINCAGVLVENTLVDGKVELWRKVLDINVIGVCICTREAIRIMKNNDINGHIVHINSIVGHYVPNSGLKTNMYPASKHAITALTETLRQELNSLNSNIKVTSVSPGSVLTNIWANFPVKRSMLDPEDIADGIIYALSTPEHVQIHELTIKPIGERF